MSQCSECILYDAFMELLKVTGNNQIGESLPKCNCAEEEPKAIEHGKASDVIYYWDCPTHGRRAESFLQGIIDEREKILKQRGG